MRALLISTLCLLLVLGIWFGFILTANQLMTEAHHLLDCRPLPLEDLLLCWKKLQFSYAVFSDSGQIHEANECLARAAALLQQESPLAEAELAAFRELLRVLQQQETLSLENII